LVGVIVRLAGVEIDVVDLLVVCLIGEDVPFERRVEVLLLLCGATTPFALTLRRCNVFSFGLIEGSDAVLEITFGLIDEGSDVVLEIPFDFGNELFAIVVDFLLLASNFFHNLLTVSKLALQ